MPRLRISSGALAFRRRFFPDAVDAEWNDWRWQMRNRIKDLPTLARIVQLSDDARGQHSSVTAARSRSASAPITRAC